MIFPLFLSSLSSSSIHNICHDGRDSNHIKRNRKEREGPQPTVRLGITGEIRSKREKGARISYLNTVQKRKSSLRGRDIGKLEHGNTRVYGKSTNRGEVRRSGDGRRERERERKRERRRRRRGRSGVTYFRVSLSLSLSLFHTFSLSI